DEGQTEFFGEFHPAPGLPERGRPHGRLGGLGDLVLPDDDARHAVETRERDEYRGVAFAFAGSLQPQRDVAGEAQDVAYARAFPRAGAGDAVPHVVLERAQVDLRAALDAGFDHRVAEEFQRIVEDRWQLF